jgi:hypothetical protein
MSSGFISRGFRGHSQQGEASERLPPSQYLEQGFPVFSAGPTPRTPLERWDFRIERLARAGAGTPDGTKLLGR